MFENARRGRQARTFTTNVSKILDLKSSSEQIFFRKLTLGAPDPTLLTYTKYENQIQLIVEGTLFFKRNNEIILKAKQAQQHTI